MYRIPLIPTALLALVLGCTWAGDAPAAPATFIWPNPASVTPANDQEAAAAVDSILTHPTTKLLLDTDAQLTEAIPAFQTQTNVTVVVKREPLIQVLLTTWWQMVASHTGAPFPVMLVKRDQAEVPNGYLSLQLLTIPQIDISSAAWVFPENVDYRSVLVTQTDSEDAHQPTLAIMRQGRLIGINPAQMKALTRPVVVHIGWVSSLRRVLDLTVDALPLSDVARTLSEMVNADLIMPVQQGSQPTLTIKIHGKTIEEILSEVCFAMKWCYGVSIHDPEAWDYANFPDTRRVSITTILYVPTTKSLWQAMVEPESTAAVGAQAMLGAMRAKLPSVPVRPLITLSPLENHPQAGK